MGYILLREVKKYRAAYGEYLLQEPTITEMLTLGSIFTELQKGGLFGDVEKAEVSAILKKMFVKGMFVEADYIACMAELLELGTTDILLDNGGKKHKSEKDPEEAIDSGIFQVLHFLGSVYGKTPLELANELTYRQAIYSFVLCFNDTATNRKIAGCDIKDKDFLNARGMIVRPDSLSDQEKMNLYGRISLARRKAKNEQ